MRATKTKALLSLIAVAGCALPAMAQNEVGAAIGPRAGAFPDVIVSSVGARNSNGVNFYGASGGIGAYAIASDSCNIGRAASIWIDNTASQYRNQHPVIGGQIYRLFNGRFEQIGQSWLKHGFCAADSCGGSPAGCTSIPYSATGPGQPTGCVNDTGIPAGASSCDWLGFGRATDTYSAGLNGGQGYLGPRSEVNSWSGSFPYPWVRNGTNSVGCLNKRLLVRTTDLDPANYPGAQFFGEVVYIITDEWPGERYNNYSYRKLTRGNLGNATSSDNSCAGGQQSYLLTFASSEPTVAQQPALAAWRAADPLVKVVTVDVPNDGRIYIASRATDRGDGTWNYEYAILNMNSDRGVSSFSIPKAAAVGVTFPANHFKGIEYHSGEPYSMMPWTNASETTSASWSTQPWTANQNANAIRWSGMFNFRMVSNMAPKPGTVSLGLFKPGISTNDPSIITASGLDVPNDPPCRADFDASGVRDVQDIFSFLSAWFAATPQADFDASGVRDVQDIFSFLSAWFAGC